MRELQRIAPLSAGLVFGFMGAALGLIVGLLFFLMGLVGLSFGSALGAPAGAAGAGAVAGIFMVIVFPILYGAAGFVQGVIAAMLYNLAAAIFGGVRLEFDSRDPQIPFAVPPTAREF
ncbi:MAG TPA: hypothetical protein PKC43_14580 [Phycisphaerales bacterium]|nr:hypothetical protein [Phycisphaerales bacterium]HMP38660.1 hypothetical protein [Phycisphaerales bacterium]